VLHAASFGFLGRRHAPQEGAEAARPFEIEPAPVEAEEPAPAEARADEPRTASLPRASVGRAPATVQAAHAGDEGPGAPESASPPAPSASAFSVRLGSGPAFTNEMLGLAGRNRFLGAAPGPGGVPAAVDERPRNVAPGVDQSMREALDAHDHDLGLDVSGPIVAVVEELARPSDTPMNGRAVFEVVIDAEGDVRDVRVSEASESRASWETLGAQLGAALRTRRIAWRRKGHGWVARIEVTSRWVLPSGQAAGRVVSGPFVKTSPEGTVSGVHFDVSDLGSRPSRDVHAHVLGESTL
jgi:hypothetical protein